ncbi:GntR family transcriptional regulator [Hoeflea prorocentri]|uniref:GntR family transcriptional regulator n=1 Tax=Hoeflea prorocentri TaxID=1922333 RepID=A0A9X3UDU7_9HYPH|nr:GntR family transcriptional regulator [Hoeflea prorocentri]MCY6379472.1 GntR family transcriptional regulator [Hoeflea prorocentri]MDA5397272.1 GntR family transcriptional regulator [Hoeflea prorocentri]
MKGKTGSSVDRVYDRLRRMAADFEFKPDERINESALSDTLGASRTPLREALNRLVAEGFLTFQNGRGFFCRSLSPEKIVELYEARQAIECEALRRAVEKAADEDIQAVLDYLDRTEPHYETCDSAMELLEMDEDFHIRLVMLSGNSELVRMLRNINDRIRYVRLIDLKMIAAKKQIARNRGARLSAHRVILNALTARNEDAAVLAMRNHIERRREEATEAVRIAYSQLYVPAD